VEGLLVALSASELATALRTSRWLYASTNTAHVLGIALLVGAILPLDLRLVGLWRTVERESLVRVLVPLAAAGLALAVITGLLLFSVRALEYAAIPLFLVKLALIAIGAISAILLHLVYGFRLKTASRPCLSRAGALSMTCWLGALIAGRMVAFVGD